MGIVWPRYNIARDCSSIEYIPHSIEFECHDKKNVNFDILKFKNLRLGNNPEKDDYYISGKKFIILSDMPYYHALSDKFPQFEILNDFDNDIVPQFIVVDCAEPEPGITGFYSDIYDLYKKDFKEKMLSVKCASMLNLIIEEAYFIVDELRVVPKALYESKGVKNPPWHMDENELGYPTPFLNTNVAGGYYLDEMAIEYKELDICFNIDEIIRLGVEKFKHRVRKHVPINSHKTFGVYISRVEANKAHKGKYIKMVEEWSEKHPGMTPEEVFYKYYSQDKDAIQKFTNNKRYIENEHVLIMELEKMGFQIVDMESLTFLQQMSIIVNTKRVMSLSGSSMVNAFIADEDTAIYEICEPADFKFNFHWYFSPKRGCKNKKQFPVSCDMKPIWHRIAERSWIDNSIKDFKQIESQIKPL